VVGGWFFRKIFLEQQKILHDGIDYAIMGFLGFCTLSIVPAILFGSDPLKWLRELVPFLTLLLIFPIRESAGSRKHIKILLACFLLLSFAMAIDNFLAYKQAAARILYMWELTSFRKVLNAPLFMAVIVVASSFFVLAESKYSRLLALLILTFFGIVLIVSFWRGYWVGAVAGLAAIFWFVNWKYKLRMAIYFGICAIVFAGALFLFFGDLATFLISEVDRRITTVGSATQDLSFANRLVEAQAVIAQIKENPIVGYGLGKTYSYDPLLPIEQPTWYVHNTILFVWYKTGIFGLVCLLTMTGKIFLRCLMTYRTETDVFIKALLIGLLGCIAGMIVVSFSSSQLLEKDSALVASLVIGLVQSRWVHRVRNQGS
jgi:O-antigen ligase